MFHSTLLFFVCVVYLPFCSFQSSSQSTLTFSLASVVTVCCLMPSKKVPTVLFHLTPSHMNTFIYQKEIRQFTKYEIRPTVISLNCMATDMASKSFNVCSVTLMYSGEVCSASFYKKKATANFEWMIWNKKKTLPICYKVMKKLK